MIADLKPYGAYEVSGLPWLGQVPRHWQVKRAKSILQRVDERSTTGKEELLTVSSARGVVPRVTANVTMFKAESYLGYKLCWPGDLVINSLWAWAGGLGVSNHHGIISSAYGVYRVRPDAELTPAFLHEFVRSASFHRELRVRSKGVWTSRLQLTDLSFLDAPMLIPPSIEQSAIVRLLNWANVRLERTIQAKRKVIALLNEQKQAIIYRAVTRGLDQSIPVKPSRISWLGDLPQHWEEMSLRMRYSVELGKMLDAKRVTGRHSVPYLRNRDVQWDRILTDNLPTMDISPREIARYTVRRGDLLVCEGGQVGRAAFWNEELPLCGFQKALHRVRCLDATRDHPRFLFYQLQIASKRGLFAADGNENTIAHLTCEKLRRHRFTFPPFAEQVAISNRLDGELARFNAATSRLEREVELLREYRTRLTADVVTGKLDVREAAARLPEEAAPVVTSDDAEIADDTEPTEEEVV